LLKCSYEYRFRKRKRSTDDRNAGKIKGFKQGERLHKTLLDAAKLDYEAKNGRIASINQYFNLVIDDPHFAWLRKISALVALIDEAVSIRRPATESEALGLFNEAKILLNFEDADEEFNDKFQHALQTNSDAVLGHNDVLGLLK
jgi:hypothetical protein